MGSVLENLHKIRSGIKGHNARIVAVTKYYDESKTIEAYNAGIKEYAENKVKDALEKKASLPRHIIEDSIWHFIGHIQTNKAKKVVGNFDYIHSLDSLKIAQCLNEEAEKREIVQKVLIQVNNAGEATKGGFSVSELKGIFGQLINLKSLKIVGLMNIAPYTEDKTELGLLFEEIRELRDYLQSEYNCELPELSMGMSNDYSVALEHGATMIRLGSILFR